MLFIQTYILKINMLTCYACLGYVNLKYIFLDMFPIPPIFFVICSSRGVSHRGLAIYIKKYLNAKEELWKLKYFTIQKHNLPKII